MSIVPQVAQEGNIMAIIVLAVIYIIYKAVDQWRWDSVENFDSDKMFHDLHNHSSKELKKKYMKGDYSKE